MSQLAECSGAPKLDPRVRRTRKLLEDAMRDLMEERPYTAISVGDVTERATVNRATFYAHYLDKNDLAKSVLREDFHDAFLAALKPPREFDAKALTDAGVAAFEFIARLHRNCPKSGVDHGPALGSNLEEALQEFIFRWLELHPSGLRLFGHAGRETVATVVAWSLYGGAVRWSTLAPANRPPAQKAVAEIVNLLLRERVAVEPRSRSL